MVRPLVAPSYPDSRHLVGAYFVMGGWRREGGLTKSK